MKVTLIVLMALAASMALRRRSAALRHWVLAVAIVCAAIAPLLERFVPSWSLAPGAPSFVERVFQAPPAPPAVGSAPPAPRGLNPNRDLQTSEDASRLQVGEVLERVWVIGVVACVAFLIVGLGRLAWLASHARNVTQGRWSRIADEVSQECRLRRPVVLLQSDHPSLLVTWGLARPKIILPAAAGEWPDDLARVILCHELAHIRRGDWIVQLAGELLRAAYWFNPVVWIACRRLRLESERACDDAVLSRGIKGSEYATQLVDLARALNQWRAWLPAAAMARPSSLQRRVNAMLNAQLDRKPISPVARVGFAAILVALTVVIAAAQAFATFSGMLVDPSGAALPGARVTLSNAERQSKYEVQSNRAGEFEFVGLLPGTYALEVQLPGFRSYHATVTMTSENVHRRIPLEIGTLQETITIRADNDNQPRAARPPRMAAPRPNPPCSAAPSTGETRIGGNIRPPHKIKDAKPEYPAGMRGTTEEAVVVIDGRVGVEGFIKDIQIREGADPTFASALIAAVNQWQFDSTLLNCVPVEPSITVTAKFVPAK